MSNQPTFNTDADTGSINGEWLDPSSIELSPAHISQAAQLSHSFAPNQQWQRYLNALAQMGVEQWLAGWAPDLDVITAECDRSNPDLVAATYLYVGAFKLCLIAAGSFADTVIDLPRAVIENSATVAHFYVLVEVLEEIMQVQIHAYLRYDQLLRCQQFQPLLPNPDQTYTLPLNWFTPNPNALLLDLRCLEPAILPLPHPPTLPLSHSLTQRAINTSLWFRDQLDALAQELSWVLLPALTPATALRSTFTESALRSTLLDLENQGVSIPDAARSAYQNLYLNDIHLRLYATTWAFTLEDNTPAWSLLLMLEGETYLPANIRLSIRDANQLLTEQILDAAQHSYLYALVGGTQAEQFWVTIDQVDNLNDGIALTLPPFAFQPI